VLGDRQRGDWSDLAELRVRNDQPLGNLSAAMLHRR